MRALKVILAVLLFFFALSFLIASIASFVDPEMGPVAGIVFLGLGGLCVWGGIKLIRKPREKIKPEKNAAAAKPDKTVSVIYDKPESTSIKITDKGKAMGKCRRCGKGGIFFKVNADGLCRECERIEKLEQEEAILKKEIEAFQIARQKTEQSFNDIKERRDALYNEIAEKAKNDIEKKCEDTINKTDEFQKKYEALQEECNKSEKTISTNANKLLRVKTLFKSVQYSAKRFFDYEAVSKDMLNDSLPDEVEDLLSTTVKLKLNLMDIRELRKRYSQNNKVIKELLVKYKSRYTTKANMSIYQLMVIALEAELQNILYNMKYSKLDKAIKDVKAMTAKFQKIASDGNQSIAPTITKFIGEIEYLYIEAVNIEYEYYIQKERIKEEQKAIREQMKQEAAERKRLEEERKKVEKEEEKFKNEIDEIERLIADETDSVVIKQLEERKANRMAELESIEKKKEDIIKLEHGLAGSIYIISNLGSFGNDVFKIGMTRRLVPEERIDELGNASVPFRFDIHSIIFSKNAPELELKLHKQLHNMRVNKINLRKEFFRINIDELEELVYSVEPTAEFNKTMLAEQYNQSMAVDEVPESISIIEDDAESEDEEDSDDTE